MITVLHPNLEPHSTIVMGCVFLKRDTSFTHLHTKSLTKALRFLSKITLLSSKREDRHRRSLRSISIRCPTNTPSILTRGPTLDQVARQNRLKNVGMHGTRLKWFYRYLRTLFLVMWYIKLKVHSQRRYSKSV